MTRPGTQTHPSELAAFVAEHFPGRGIRPDRVIAQSWYRSVMQHGLDPATSTRLDILCADDIRHHQEQHQQYLDIASQGVSGLARRVVPAGFAVLLSDAQGITLDARLPCQHDPYIRSGLVVGARWDESIAGTNGIGTTLAAAEPLIIHREEHFLTANARLSCSVAPIFNAQGLLQGCLNATCLDSNGPKESQYLTLQLVILYARLIENAHFRQSYRDRLTLSLKPIDEIADLANEQLLAVDDSGRVIGANYAAFIAHDQADGRKLLGTAIEQLLPMGVDELLRLTHGGARGLRLRALQDEALLDVSLRIPSALSRQAPTPGPAPKVQRPRHPDLDRLAGADPGLQQTVRRLRKVIDKDIAILITGETGTGKEAFARAIHQASARRAGPFVALNCAAIPESLIESELFGYHAGSFTGAGKKGMKGKLELANGGTLFLDEIGDMPAHLQTRLLRVLAEREISPLGAPAPVALDIQVVCATHQDLQGMLREKDFREDLFYRLNGMTLRLPALRERSDRGQLIDSLLDSLDEGQGMRLSVQARQCLVDAAWPGNIRQLLNALRYAMALADEGVIDLDCLPGELLHGVVPASAEPQGSDLQAVLRRHRWNISAAAAELGVARSTLYRQMKKRNLVQPNDRL
ncbi:sigma-54-dependent Fis family transcriptional regulator [Pseudomonas sp. 148P]|uniref:Sigma-54-dependent Fis family transcriptional regulator n=1 Tax=Pseudomonas ulcerans TaxID=3115852 RepID=A0ABU7HX38_9PSED|nr:MULTISPECIES: sigma-54-dependent Fis family transcriptional regulator [unclassified Pseudomonas]MEE1924720.1 sigma-54-dependent Fis family transcriptional regulator [Pseudomonas sp. 147P]MEE1936129.1 sigma-54-dependent Fis family transcriptional regulator [Pseudomonas sp. 148P]